MIVLTIRTNNPQAELGLYDGPRQIGQISWQAHKTLTVTIHQKLQEMLGHADKHPDDIEAVVAFKGPGSFTGLRIGLSVANALAYSYEVPIVSCSGDDWIKDGINLLSSGQNHKVALPEYGGPALTSSPSK